MAGQWMIWFIGGNPAVQSSWLPTCPCLVDSKWTALTTLTATSKLPQVRGKKTFNLLLGGADKSIWEEKGGGKCIETYRESPWMFGASWRVVRIRPKAQINYLATVPPLFFYGNWLFALSLSTHLLFRTLARREKKALEISFLCAKSSHFLCLKAQYFVPLNYGHDAESLILQEID